MFVEVLIFIQNN